MERWNSSAATFQEDTRIDGFIEDIINTCRKWGLSISHEDVQGAFIVEAFNEASNDWLREASIGRSVA